MSDDIKAIRDALAACPHKGAWLHRAKSSGLFTPPPAGTPYTYGTHLTQLGDDAEGGAEDGEVIDFIVACHPERIARLLDALEQAQKDARRLQFLEDQTMEGNAPNLVFDDDGNWSVSYTGMQPMPRGDGQGFDETVTIACIVEPSEWRPSIRAAIDAAMATQAAPLPVHPAAPAVPRIRPDPAPPAPCCAGPDPAPTDRP